MKIPIVQIPTIALAGSADRFPVRRIFCVGQNYAEHAREMGSDPQRSAPFFFTKPADAVVDTGSELPFPSATEDLHHEVELVIGLGAGGANVSPAEAASMIFGYAVGVDLTRRDLQSQAKKAGRPWDMAKGFDKSAPIGPLSTAAPPDTAAIRLLVNGEARQEGKLTDMIWKPTEIIATLSTFVALAPGDLIFTGTPSGVGAIGRGDSIRGEIDRLEPVAVAFQASAS